MNPHDYSEMIARELATAIGRELPPFNTESALKSVSSVIYLAIITDAPLNERALLMSFSYRPDEGYYAWHLPRFTSVEPFAGTHEDYEHCEEQCSEKFVLDLTDYRARRIGADWMNRWDSHDGTRRTATVFFDQAVAAMPAKPEFDSLVVPVRLSIARELLLHGFITDGETQAVMYHMFEQFRQFNIWSPELQAIWTLAKVASRRRGVTQRGFMIEASFGAGVIEIAYSRPREEVMSIITKELERWESSS